ncbi:MAG: hypothetical protein ACP5C3_00490 [Methanomicrobiales archaeon]
MGYLLCEKCMGYIKLKEGESPHKYKKCKCGGNLIYLEKKTDILKKGDYLEKLPQELGIQTSPRRKKSQILFLIIYISIIIAFSIIIIATVFTPNEDPQLQDMIKERGSSNQANPENIINLILPFSFYQGNNSKINILDEYDRTDPK